MAAENTQFDLVVIGAGPGGYVAAVRAARLGLKTAIVEKHSRLGGTCLNVGCIPTKALLHAADLLDEMREAQIFGLKVGEVTLDIPALQKRKEQVVKTLTSGVAGLMQHGHVTVLQGMGSIAGKGKVAVLDTAGKKTVLDTRFTLLATGTAPRGLPGLPFDGQRVIHSDHALEFKKVPESILIIGAGAVGTEFASIFARFGAKVTLVEMLPHVCNGADEDVCVELEAGLKRQKIDVRTNTKVNDIKVSAKGVEAILAGPDGKASPGVWEQVLVAVGRGPVTAELGLEKTAAKADRGFVIVDQYMRTAEPGVYAIGDIRPGPQLAHVASAEGIVAAEHMAGKKPLPVDHGKVPFCVYCEPQVAWVGMTEAQAKAKGRAVKIGKFNFGTSGKALILGKRRGFIKFVTDAGTGEVLGIHMIGPQVTDLIGEAGFALNVEATAEDIARTVHAHPTLNESVMEAAMVAAGLAVHG